MEIVKILWEIVLGGLAIIAIYSMVCSVIKEIRKAFAKKKVIAELEMNAKDFVKNLDKIAEEIKKLDESNKRTTKTKTKKNKED